MVMVKQNIFIVGPMGSGKTSVGKSLAKTLNFTFYDSDQVIEDQSGADIPWIFDIEGESGFRKREAKVIEQLTQLKEIVLATGGGVVIEAANRRNLASRGFVVYLKVSVAEQVRRTYRSRTRPLILNKNPEEVFERLQKEREAFYHEVADMIIETDHGSIRTIVETILSRLAQK